MIYEVAHIVVKADMGEAFEKGAAEATPLFLRARGCRSFELQHGME